jgi:cytochrome P450
MSKNDSSENVPGEQTAAPLIFDHHSAEYVANHGEILRELRDVCPIAHSPLHGGFSVVTKYKDVATAARDDDTFSSAWRADGTRGGINQPPFTDRRVGLLAMDPPESTAYRRALMPFFTKAAIESREEELKRIVEDALDSVIENGACDLVEDFTDRIPAVTTLSMLGLPLETWRPFAHFLHDFIVRSDDEEKDRWFLDFLAEEIAARKADPRDDGLSWIVNSEIDGQKAPDDVILENVFLIMVGGFDPTSAFLANSLLYLSQHEDDRSRLKENPDLLESACEEFLRFYTPVMSLARTVTTNVRLGRTDLSEGDRVLLSWYSANHDEEMFTDSEHVVLDRFPNRHQAFGLGSHRCLGSHLARATFRLAVGDVLERIPDYRINVDKSKRFPEIPVNNGWFSMPMEFTPGKRLHESSDS